MSKKSSKSTATSGGETPLDFMQQAMLTGTRLIFGTAMGALSLFRESGADGWRTLRYGPLHDEVLDYLPTDVTPALTPVVFIHGGGWMMGTKDFYSADLEFLVAGGHPVFNIEYPKAPEHPHPQVLQAVFRALAFIRATFPQYEAVHLVGDSAGGNLALMAGLVLANSDLASSIVPGIAPPKKLPGVGRVVSLYGVLDRTSCLNGGVPGGEMMMEAYGGAAVLADTVDLAHAITPLDVPAKTHPPTLLMCGDKDPLFASHTLYADHAKAKKFEVTATTYAGANHGFFNFPDGATKHAAQAEIAAFLNS